MVGGDDAAPGTAQKTALHLVISAVTAFVMPRARRHVQRLTELIDALDHKARELLASDANVASPDAVRSALDEKVVIPLKGATHEHFDRLAGMIRELTDLRWRYTEGPGGKGRAACGMTNDGSTEWGSTYPFNPYPFPWASHLLQDAPSVAIGIFEGQMRKMARGFAWVRRAELELAGEYDAQVHEPALSALDWRQFTDDELALCPPVLAVGGAASMLDLGLQNLSRLLASDRPVRAVVFDTPGVADADRQDPLRRDLPLLALAHRRAFVLQSSAATPSHLVAGVTRGLAARGPALFVLHGPSPSTRPTAAMHQAKVALESRMCPALSYDPTAGAATSERLSLDGNPTPDQLWPTYELEYVDGSGATHTVTLPVTVADWAATEPALQRHFTEPAADVSPDELMRFDEYLAAPPEECDGKTPFIYVLDDGRHLERRAVSADIVALARDRVEVWRHLRQLAGFELPDAVRARVVGPVEADFERRLNDLEVQHRARVAEVESRYPALVARRLVEGLLRASGDGSMTVADLLERAAAAPGLAAIPPVDGNGSKGAAPPAPIVMPAPPATAPATDAPPPLAAPPPAPVAAAPLPAAAEAEAALTMDPYIQSELCTSCDECVNLNRRMFAYNKQKQAYIKDPKAGTFRQLVMAAEKCPVSIIHPGTPLNPDEPDLAKWVEQAARYQ
jgi:pyruvate-ferredoxin/flavodoxin oxidoreductase